MMNKEEELIDRATILITKYIKKNNLKGYIKDVAESVALTDLYNELSISKEKPSDKDCFKLIDTKINNFKKHDRFALYIPKKQLSNHSTTNLEVLDETTCQDALRRTKRGYLGVLLKDEYYPTRKIYDRFKGVLRAFNEVSTKSGKLIGEYLYREIVEEGQWRRITNKEIATALDISTRTVARQRKILNKYIEEEFGVD